MSTTNSAPEEIHNVSHGYFSVARHYGGCKISGHSYVYDPTRDVLIRSDVLKARRKAERAARPRKGAKGKAGPGDTP